MGKNGGEAVTGVKARGAWRGRWRISFGSNSWQELLDGLDLGTD